MTNIELILNMLAEASATELSQNQNPANLTESADIAIAGQKLQKMLESLWKSVAVKQLQAKMQKTLE